MVVEAIIEIIVESSLFGRFRNFISGWVFVGKLFTCPYCLSVWASAGVCWLLPNFLDINIVIWYVLHIFFVHRLSNILHSIINPKLQLKPKEEVIHIIDHNRDSDGL